MYNDYSNSSISTVSPDTEIVGARQFVIRFFGLRPNTKHKVYLDGVDYTWACKGWGQNLGEDILTNEYGVADFRVLFETSRQGRAELEEETVNSVAYYSGKVNPANRSIEDVVKTSKKTFYIRSADGLSSGQQIFHFHMVSKHNPVNQ